MTTGHYILYVHKWRFIRVPHKCKSFLPFVRDLHSGHRAEPSSSKCLAAKQQNMILLNTVILKKHANIGGGWTLSGAIAEI